MMQLICRLSLRRLSEDSALCVWRRTAILFFAVALHSYQAMNACAQSFHPIEIPPVPYSLHRPVAIVRDISPDGSRVAGAISENGVTYDCYGRCTLPFIWSLPHGTEVNSLLGPVQLYTSEYGAATLPVEEIASVTDNAALANGFGGYFSEPFLIRDDVPNLIRDISSQSLALLGMGLSNDGEVIVGSISDREFRSRPFRWTSETGVVPIESGQLTSMFTSISDNGLVAAGTAGDSIYQPYTRAFQLSEAEEIEYLEPLHSLGGIFPSALSYNGSVIVGTARGQLGYLAFRWTSNEGTQPLPVPDGFTTSAGEGISADGETIVGRLMTVDQRGGGGTAAWAAPHIHYLGADPAWFAEHSHAMIWNSTSGTRVLKDVLSQVYGLGDSLAAWSLITASAISGDGKVIGGVGVNPVGEFQGWVAILAPEPNSTLIATSLLAIVSLVRNKRSNTRLSS